MKVSPTRSRLVAGLTGLIEPLESRIAPANFVLPAGGGPYTLELDPADSHIHITSGAAGEIFDQGLAPGNDLFITGGAAADVFTIANSAVGNVSFTGTLSVNIPGPIHVNGAAGTGVDFVLTSGADIAYSTAINLGTSGAHFRAGKNILFTNNSSLTATSGNIVLLANQAVGQVGTFAGINLDHANIITNGSGTIMLTGTGGNQSSNNFGIELVNDAEILSTATVTPAGTITLTGKGGPGLSADHGVFLTGLNTLVSSVSGAILINGTGDGTTGADTGVTLDNGAQISSTGAGANAAPITINGTGSAAAAGANNYGVLVMGGGKISARGPMTVTGTEGGGAGSEGIAVLGANSTIQSTVGFSLIANNINLDPVNAVINAGTANVQLSPRVAGTAIDVGGPDQANPTLGLNDGELDRITAGSVQIGDAASGQINVSTTITQTKNLALISGAVVTASAVSITLDPGKDFSVTGNTGIDLSAATLTVSGTTTLTAGNAANVVVNNPANDLGNVLVVSGASVSLRDDATGFNISGATITTLLTLQSNNLITQSGAIAGAGGVTMQGGGQLLLSVPNTYAGPTTMISGVLKLGAADVIPDGAGKGDVSVNIGAQFDLNGFNETIDGLTSNGAVTNSAAATATLTLGNNNATSTFSGAITGALALAKIGTGTLTLSNGADAYSGATTINAGTFKVGALGAIPNGNTVSVNGGTLDLNGFDETVGGFALLNGTVLGAAKLTSTTDFDLRSGTVSVALAGNVGVIVSGGGTVIYTAPGSYTGATEIRDGTIKLSGAVLPIGTNLILGDASNHSGVLDLNNVTQDVAGLTTVGTGANNRIIDSSVDVVVPVLTVNLAAGTDTFSGTFGGANADGLALTKTGAGTLVLTNTNTYTGTTNITAGTLQIGNGTTGTLGSGAVTNNGSLVFNRSNAITVNNAISGGGTLTLTGVGTVTLGGTNTYTGATTANFGTLLVTGSLTGSAAVNIAHDATLGGTGTIVPPTPTNIAGTLAPGVLPGALNTGNVAFLAGSIFSADVTAGAQSQLKVTGTVALGNATFTTTGTATSSPGQKIVLIDNDSNDPVTGTFANLAEGAPVTINGVLFHITYAGGTNNNDVVLAQPAVETEITLSAGDLVVTDIVAGGHDSTLTLADQTASTGSFVISDPARNLAVTGIPGASVSADLHTATIPATAVTGTKILVNDLSGDDTLTLNLNLGALTKALTFDGGTQATADQLVINGPTFTSASYDFADAQSGSVTLAGNALISYLGLEGVTNTLSAANVTLNYNANGALNTIGVTGVGGGKLDAASAAGVPLDFIVPTSALNINGGPSADTINITSLTGFSGALTIDGNSGSDLVNLAAGLPTLAALKITTDNISALPALTIGAGGLDIAATKSAIDINGGITSTGKITLQSGGAITNAAGVVAAPSITASAVGGINFLIDSANLSATNTGASGVTVKNGATITNLNSLDPGLGSATFNGGTFKLGKTAAITRGASLSLNATLDLNGFLQTVADLSGAGAIGNSSVALSTLAVGAGNASATFAGTISGHVALEKIGVGTQILSGSDTAPDGTTIFAGTLQFEALGSALNGQFTLGGGTLSYNLPGANATLSPSVTLSQSSSIGVASGKVVTLTNVVTGFGGLSKIGGGTLVLANELNDFGPAKVSILGGTLQVAKDGALGDPGNDVEINNATFAASAAFASARDFSKTGGVATIDAQVPNLTLINKAIVPADLTPTTPANLQFAIVYANTTPVPSGTIGVGGTTVSIGGKGTLVVHKDLSGTMIDTLELSGTDLTTKLVIKGPATGFTTINHIIIDSADPNTIASIGSIVLGKNVRLGDELHDSVSELFVEGKTGALQLYDLNSYAFLSLGSGLPYNVATDKKTPDTYNHHPNLTIHDVRGPGVIFDLTPSDLPTDVGGNFVGGGGLGKIVVNSWDFSGPLGTPGIAGGIRTTQSIGGFKLLHGDCSVVFAVDKNHVGTLTRASVGSMVIQSGSWGSSGSEIEGDVHLFDADGFIAGATLTAASMGLTKIGTGGFAGVISLLDGDAPGIPTFTVDSNFTGDIVTASPIKKLKVKGDFTGSLEAFSIGSITAYSFLGNNLPGHSSAITATDGSLGTLTATAGVVRNFSITTDQAFKGFNVKVGKLTGDTIGIDNVHIQARAIGNIGVSLAAAAGATGIDLVGIRNSDFITTGTGTTAATLGSIGNITVTLTGTAGGASATGIVNSTFDALVNVNEFGVNPASTLNALGKITVKISGQDGPSLGLDGADFSGNNIGATTVSVSRGKGMGATASAIDVADFTASDAIGAMSIDGDATSAQVTDLQISAGANIGAITVKSKDLVHGTLADSAILAGQSLDMTGSADAAKLARAALAAVTVSGSISHTDLVAGGSIAAVTAGGGLTDSHILAGAKLGADHLLGGSGANSDAFQRSAAIAAITVKGLYPNTSFARTSIAAGVNPVNGIFGDAGDIAATFLPGTSSIGPITIPAGVLAAVTGSQHFAIEAGTITSIKIGSASPVAISAPHLLDLTPAGPVGDNILVRLVT